MKFVVTSFPYMIPLAMLLAWGFFYIQYPVSPNIALLVSFVQKMLHGGILGIDYYDTNPPLSMLFYAPVALLNKWTGLSLHSSTILYSLAAIAYGAAATGKILKSIPTLARDDRLILIFAYIFSCTVASRLSVGERDHLIALSLVPFILLQYCYLKDYAVSKALQYIVLGIGTFAILLKPPFGLLPTLFLIFRLVKKKEILRFYKAPDFIALASGTILYTLTVLLFFPNFIKMILPDLLDLYVPGRDLTLVFRDSWALLAAVIFSGFLAFQSKNKPSRAQRDIVYILVAIACTSIFNYALQGKGFFYHQLPALVAVWMLIVYAAYLFILSSKFVKKINIGWLIGFASFIFYADAAFPVVKTTYKDIIKGPVAGLFDEYCGKPCTFLMIGALDTVYLNTFYLDAISASRMASPWFLYFATYSSELSDIEKIKIFDIQKKYSSFYIEDINKNKPEMIVIQKPLESELDLKDYLLGDSFIWQDYKYRETVTIADKDYSLAILDGAVRDYDVYVRKED